MTGRRPSRFWTVEEKRLIHVMEEDFTFSSFGASQILTTMLLGEVPRDRRARTRAGNASSITEEDFRALKGEYERYKDEPDTEWARIVAELDSPEHQEERDALKAAITTTAESHEIDNYLDWGRPSQPSRPTTLGNTPTYNSAVRSSAPTPSPTIVKLEHSPTISSSTPPAAITSDSDAPMHVAYGTSADIAGRTQPNVQVGHQATNVPSIRRTNWQTRAPPSTVRLQGHRQFHNFAEQITGPESSSDYVVDHRAGNLRPVFVCIAGQWILQHTTSRLHRRSHSM